MSKKGKARRLAKWPDTDGTPPWVIEARARLKKAGKAAKPIVEAVAAAALKAVKVMAKEAIKGALKSSKAVDAVMLATGIDEDEAIDAVFNAFEKMEAEHG